MPTAAQTVTRNAPETDSRKTQVTVSWAIHVLSTEDEPRQVVTQGGKQGKSSFSHTKNQFLPPLQAIQPNATGSDAIDGQGWGFHYNFGFGCKPTDPR